MIVCTPLPPLLLGALLLASVSGQAVFSSSAVCYTKSFSFGVCVLPERCQVRGDGSSRCSADQVCCKRDQVQLSTTTTTTTTPPPPVQLVDDCGLAHPNTFLLRSRRALTSPAEFDVPLAADVYHKDIVGLLVTGGADDSRFESPREDGKASHATSTAAGESVQSEDLAGSGKISLIDSEFEEHTNAHGGFEHSVGYAAMMKHTNGHTNGHTNDHTDGHTNGHTGMEHINGHSGAEEADISPPADIEVTTLAAEASSSAFAVDEFGMSPVTESSHDLRHSESETVREGSESSREVSELVSAQDQGTVEESTYVEGADKKTQVNDFDQVSIWAKTEGPTTESPADFAPPLEAETELGSANQELAKHSLESSTYGLPTTFSTESPLTLNVPATTAAAETAPTAPSDAFSPTPSSTSTVPTETTDASADTAATVPAADSDVTGPAADSDGEELATVGRWPWIALLGEADQREAGTRWFCTGTLIAPSTVLTAARCVTDRAPAGITVRLGEYDLSKTGDGRLVEVAVAAVTVHPQHRASQHDLALLRLERPVAFSTRVRPACLPAAGADLTGAEADLAGWRQLRRLESGRQQLAQVRLHVMDGAECEQTYRDSPEFEASFPGGFGGAVLCAIGRDGSSRDACQGDAGGPLVVREQSGRYQVVGVSASGLGCHIPHYPAVYTKVSEYIAWISDNSQ